MYSFSFHYLSCNLWCSCHNIHTYRSLCTYSISPVHTDKRRTNRIHPTLCILLYAFASCSYLHFSLCLHSYLPSSPSYLFTYLALLSGCIQLDSALFHSSSLIITTTPICILSHYTLLHTCLLMFALHLHSLALCTHA